MTKAHERQIQEMLASGSITQADAQRLRTALEAKRYRWKALLDPLGELSTKTVIGIALLVLLAEFAVSILGFRFDGALDLHSSGKRQGIQVVLLDAVSGIVSAAAVFWLFSLALARQGRAVDFLLSVIVSRMPVILSALLLYWTLPPPAELEAMALQGTVSLKLILGVIPTLPLLVWSVVVLYKGYRTSSGLRGARCGLSFAIGLVAAEILSKLGLYAASVGGFV